MHLEARLAEHLLDLRRVPEAEAVDLLRAAIGRAAADLSKGGDAALKLSALRVFLGGEEDRPILAEPVGRELALDYGDEAGHGLRRIGRRLVTGMRDAEAPTQVEIAGLEAEVVAASERPSWLAGRVSATRQAARRQPVRVAKLR